MEKERLLGMHLLDKQKGLGFRVLTRDMLKQRGPRQTEGLYRENGEENGNYYHGVIWGSVSRLSG